MASDGQNSVIPETVPQVIPPPPASLREKILGMGKDQLSELYRKLHDGGQPEREQFRTELEQSTFDELKTLSEQVGGVGSTPAKLEQLKAQAHTFSEKFVEDFTAHTRSPEELEQIVTGYRIAQEQGIHRDSFVDLLHGNLDHKKQIVLGGAGSSVSEILGAAGVLSFSDTEQAKLQSAQSEKEFDAMLKEFTRNKTEKYFGKRMELDTEDLMIVSQEIVAEKQHAVQKKPNFFEKIPGVKTVIETVSGGKNLVYFFVIRRASEDLKISKGTLFHLAGMTVADLRAKIGLFDPNDAHIDPKAAEACKLLDEIDKRRDELEDALDYAIKNFHQDGFTDEDRERLRLSLTVEQLSISSILSYWYMDASQRENWFTHAISRWPAFRDAYKYWWKNYEVTMGGLGSLRMGKHQYQAWENEVSGDLKNHLSKGELLELEKIEKEFTALDSQIKAFPKKLAEAEHNPLLFRKVQAERDVLVRRYNVLAHEQLGPLLSRDANAIVRDGKVMEEVAAAAESHAASKGAKGMSGKFRLDQIASTLSDEQRAFLTNYKISIKDSRTLAEWKAVLADPWNRRLGNFMQTQELWTDKFQGLRKSVQSHIEEPFVGLRKGAKLQAKTGGQIGAEATHELKQTQFVTGRYKKIAGMLALPAVIIGSEFYALSQGQVQGSEMAWDLVEAGSGFVPVAGTVLDFKAAFSGKSLSGRKLSFGEQAAYFTFGLIGAVSDVGTFAFGLGYGLRAGVNALRGARTAKNVLKAGRFDSLLFRGGAKMGEMFSVFKAAGRERRLAHVVEGMEVEKDMPRFLELSRKFDRYEKGKSVEKLTAAEEMELRVFASRGLKVEDLNFLQRRGFYRKGSELWLQSKNAIYRKGLPKEVVDKLDAAQAALRKEQDALSKVQAEIQAIRKESLTKPFSKTEFDEWAKIAKNSKKVDERAQWNQISQKGLVGQLKSASDRYDRVFYAWKAENSKFEIEQMIAVRKLQSLDKVGKAVMRVGAPAAAIMLISAGNVSPVEAVEAGADVVGTGAHAAGSVFGEVMKDHTPPNAIESAVEDQIAGVIAMNERRAYLEEQKKKGIPAERVFAEHADDEGFQQLAAATGHLKHMIPSESLEYQKPVTV